MQEHMKNIWKFLIPHFQISTQYPKIKKSKYKPYLIYPSKPESNIKTTQQANQNP